MTISEIKEAIKYFEEMIVKYPENSSLKFELEKYQEKLKNS